MSEQVVEQIIRPTGLLDPEVEVRPTKGQVDDLLHEIRIRAERGERVLVTTLTKKMAEDLADYLIEMGVKTHYLHSEIQTFERVEILRDLRLGVYDVVVGINLLREGLDLPEVSLVAILDADKEGYLRSEWSLIQTMGRAARNVNGTVIMYADVMTDSMRRAIEETDRRRRIQEAYNREHGIEPEGIRKAVRDITDRVRQVAEEKPEYSTGDIPKDEIARLIKDLEKQMKDAAQEPGVREGGAPPRPGRGAAPRAGRRRRGPGDHLGDAPRRAPSRGRGRAAAARPRECTASVRRRAADVAAIQALDALLSGRCIRSAVLAAAIAAGRSPSPSRQTAIAGYVRWELLLGRHPAVSDRPRPARTPAARHRPGAVRARRGRLPPTRAAPSGSARPRRTTSARGASTRRWGSGAIGAARGAGPGRWRGVLPEGSVGARPALGRTRAEGYKKPPDYSGGRSISFVPLRPIRSADYPLDDGPSASVVC